MSQPSYTTKSPTIRRILKEATELTTHPDPTLHAAPLDSNLFEWHFTLTGPPSTPYSAGIYHGRIILPPTYPLRPPSFRFLTPSGRFEVNREICLSISGHHEETWQPAWGIRTALWALRAFMEGDARGQVGGMDVPREERERLAEESRGWRCGACGGRRNEDLMREEGGKAGEKGKGREVVVPEELRLGFRDQMGKGEGDKGKEKEIPVANENEQNIPPITASQVLPEPSAPPSSAKYATPQPTSTVPAATSTYPPQPTPIIRRQDRSDGVPPWVDKAITGVIAALVVMVFKKILI